MVLKASDAVKTLDAAIEEKVTAIDVELDSDSVTGGSIPEYKHNTHHMKKSNTVNIKKSTMYSMVSKIIFPCTNKF